jgi:HK97 family phage portal protein
VYGQPVASFIKRFRAAWTASTVKEVGGGGFQFSNSTGAAPIKGDGALLQSYGTSPPLFMVTDRIASSFASVHWRLFYRRGDVDGQRGKRTLQMPRAAKHGDFATRRKSLATMRELQELEEIEDHPFLRMLTTPNESGQTGYDTRKLTQLMLDISGNAVWIIQRDNGVAARAFVIPSTWVTRAPSFDEPFYMVNMPDNPSQKIPVTDVWWFKNPNPADPMGPGVGLGRVLGDELDIFENASKNVSTYFYNNSMPAFIASIKGAGAGALKRAQVEWGQAHSTFSNAYRTKWTSGEIDVKRLDTSFKDSEMTALRKQSKEDVVHTAGVPKEILGMTEDSNRATSWVARQHYGEFTIVPRCESIRNRWQAILDVEYDDRLLLWYDSPLPKDDEFILEVMGKHPTAYTENDWRDLTGHFPLPTGGDVHLIPTNLVARDTPAEAEAPAPPVMVAPEPAEDDEDEDGDEPSELDPDEEQVEAAKRTDPAWSRSIN